MGLRQICGLWKDVVITVAGAACVYFAIIYGGELGRLQNGSPIKVGLLMSIPGESMVSRHRDLIIFGSDSCRFSRESIEFDRKLLLTAASLGLPVHIISPTSSAARWYSSQLSLPSSSILVHGLGSLGITGTPTVVLRDESGIVQGLWEGLLPLNEQHAVLLRVAEKKHILEQPHFEDLIIHSFGPVNENSSIPPKVAGPPVEIDENGLHALGTDHTVIDLRERDSFLRMWVEREVNIPFHELDVRARIELNHDIPTIVDCSSIDVGTCDLAALKLVSLRFVSVSVLDRGARGRACGITPVRQS
jgi:hypothetical protein